MYRFFSMAKNKTLPAVVAAVFIASTAFLSSAAAQKMIQAAASSQKAKIEKKNSGKSLQTSIRSSEPEDASGPQPEPSRAIRTALSGTALAALTVAGSEDDNAAANSTVASTTIQTAGSNGMQAGSGSISVSETSGSRWAEEDEFVKSDGNVLRENRWEDDGEDDN